MAVPRVLLMTALIGLTVLNVPARAQASWQFGSNTIYTVAGTNVGIGTSAPASALDLVQSVGGSAGGIRIQNGSETYSLYGSAGGNLYINAAASGYSPSLLLQSAGGNVGIGTVTPQYPLSVNGTIQAKEVIVNTGWSDYVFAPDYPLKSLNEISAYIQDHHHLPDIPSAGEIARKGVSLGEMEAKLLAKIEELTLQMIQTEDRSKRLEEDNRALLQRVTRLEQRSRNAASDESPRTREP